MFWKRATGDGAFFGLLSGTGAAALVHGLTVAEGKGGWIQNLHTFPSNMAQNFWIAIFAWSTCFLTTILVSSFTKPRAESELHGLVYGLTSIPHDGSVVWYKRPIPLAFIVVGVLILLNVWFR
jgi:SSS family solute:Na+ symporter